MTRFRLSCRTSGTWIASIVAAAAAAGANGADLGGVVSISVPASTSECTPSSSRNIVCSLGDAIEAANRAEREHVIWLDRGGLYEIEQIDHLNEGGNGLPAVTGRLTIEGKGATIARSSAPGTPIFRLLRIGKEGDLVLRDLTVRNGATPHGFDGAAIWNTGKLSIERSVLEHNHSGDDGGAIRSDGVLSIADSVVRWNTAQWRGGVGGGLQTTTQFGKAQTHISRTRFEGNHAWAAGGALWLQGTSTLVDTVIVDNRASDRGGGIQNYGVLEIRGSSIVDNQAGVTAGGIHSFRPVVMSDTEILRNRAMLSADCEGVMRLQGNVRIGRSFRCLIEDNDEGASAADAGRTDRHSSSEAAVRALVELGARIETRTEPNGPGRLMVTTDSTWRGGDDGLTYLKHVDGLYKLRLGGRITDEGLRHLAAIPGLTELDIHVVGITDEGVRALAPLAGLRRLNLTYTRVTDDGLRAIATMTQLQWLGLAYTNVSADGVDELRSLIGDAIIEGNFLR